MNGDHDTRSHRRDHHEHHGGSHHKRDQNVVTLIVHVTVGWLVFKDIIDLLKLIHYFSF